MLNFLNTAVLVAAAAAIFPFLLHLFSRRKVKVVPFSSVTFLKAMQKRQVRAIKIKQILLLIVRTLIILAIVLAFARPATEGGYLGSHASVSAVIILDNSASMGQSVRDGRLYDLAQRKALEISAQMGQDDEIAVLATCGRFAPSAGSSEGKINFGSAATAADIIIDIPLTDMRSDAAEIYRVAVDLLAERPNLNREIYVLSDFQDNAWGMASTPGEFDGSTFLVDLPGEKIDNAGVVNVDLGGQLIGVGTPFTVTATIKKHGGVADDHLVSLYLDDDRVAQQGVPLTPGGTATVDFAVMVTEPGFHDGRVMLSDDDLVADNQHFFTFYIPDRFTILLLGGDGLDMQLFKLALAPEESIRRHWAVQQAAYAQLSGIRLDQYDVIVLGNVGDLSSGNISRLSEYVRDGGGLLINVGRSVDSAVYNDNFAEISGIRLTSEFPRQYSRAGHYIMGEFDLTHQIFNVFAGDDQGTPGNVKSYVRLQAEQVSGVPGDILARWSDGSPAVAVAPHGRGRVMLLNCDVSPDISDISLHPFFVPMIVRGVEFLSGDFSGYSETILAGSEPNRILRRDFSVSNDFTLEMPDGARRVVPARYQGENRIVDPGQMTMAGIYSIWNGATESDRFAVNVDPSEGDLYRADVAERDREIIGAIQLPFAREVAGFLSEQRFGRELWQYFLIAALLLLAVEMYLARDRGTVATDA